MSAAILVSIWGCPDGGVTLAPKSGTVRGSVTQRGQPVQGARVVFLRTSGGFPVAVSTDVNGDYEVQLEPGVWHGFTSVSEAGCSRTESIDIQDGDRIGLDFQCEPIAGLYDAFYDPDDTTCEVSLDPATYEATATTQPQGEDTEVSFHFPDAPEPVRGILDLNSFIGVAKVSIGDDVFTESWDVQLDYTTGGDFEFVGQSYVDVSDDAGQVCYRDFTIVVTKQF